MLFAQSTPLPVFIMHNSRGIFGVCNKCKLKVQPVAKKEAEFLYNGCTKTFKSTEIAYCVDLLKVTS